MRSIRRVVAVAGLAVVLSTSAAAAQDLEPRAYSNVPVGMNFLILAYAYSHGDVAFDQSVPIEDAELTINAVALGYARSIDVWGRAGKLDVVIPQAWLSGSAKVAGQPQEREVSGLGDPRFRLSVLLYGAPSLTLEQFASYHPDLIVGVSLAVTAPLGQYDSTRLINVGTNRWSIKPELGISKTLGPFTFELATSVTFYTTNHDFLRGGTLEKSPLFAAQLHAIYHTPRGLWAAIDATYYAGGRATINGGEPGDRLENLRLGATLAIPLTKYHSLKLYGSAGAMARTGGNFNTLGIAWQYRWGAGL